MRNTVVKLAVSVAFGLLGAYATRKVCSLVGCDDDAEQGGEADNVVQLHDAKANAEGEGA